MGGREWRKKIIVSMQCNNCAALKLSVVYLKCKFNWESCVLSGNRTQGLSFSIRAVMKKDLGEFKLSLRLNFPCFRPACVHVLFVFL